MDPVRTARRLRWIGGPTVELTLGRFCLLTDPMLSSGPRAFIMNGHPSTGADHAPIARTGEVPEVDLEAVDLVLVSHLHSDHFDREARERLPRSTPVLAPTTQVSRLVEWGFVGTRGLAWWDSWELVDGAQRLDITAVPAHHSADEDTNAMLGIVNGYVIRHEDAQDALVVYWTGDTVWFQGLGDLGSRLEAPDVLVPHIGAVGRGGPWGRMTLDAEEARRLMQLFAPARTIPIHHHTFSHYVEPVDALVDLLEGSPEASRLRVLREGGTAEL